MFDFDDVCKKVDDMHPYAYSALISEKRATVVEALKDINKNGLSGITIYNGLVLGAVVSDGKLAEEEFYLVKPLIDSAFNEKLSYKEAKSLVKYLKPGNEEYEIFVSAVDSLFKTMTDDLKYDIVAICLLVCAIDGKISLREKKWLKQLIKQ